MIVILLKDLKGTGKAGDVVKVSDGYARNVLIPKGVAREATEGNVRSLEKQKALAVQKEEENRAKAQELAARLGELTVQIETKGGEGGRLFGSITSKDIADALKEQHQIEVDKKKIVLDNPIKLAGESDVHIKLYPEISGKLHVVVSVR
jgi:large subunit ribosomal protein L9